MEYNYPDFTYNSLGEERRERILKRLYVDDTKTHTFVSMACLCLEEEFNVEYQSGSTKNRIVRFYPVEF